MTAVKLDAIVDDYLARLNNALEGFPTSQREQIVESISIHIEEARATTSTENEVTIREILEHLGDPSEIASAAEVDLAAGSHRRSRRHVRRLVGSALALVVAGVVVLALFVAGTFGAPPVRYGIVPNVMNLPFFAAEQDLTYAGFRPWLECTPPDIFPGRVMSMSPRPSFRLPLGSYVYFTAGSSPPGCHTTQPPWH